MNAKMPKWQWTARLSEWLPNEYIGNITTAVIVKDYLFWFILRRAHLEHSIEVWWSHRYFYVRWLRPGPVLLCARRDIAMWLNFLAQGMSLPPAGIELGTFGLQRPGSIYTCLMNF